MKTIAELKKDKILLRTKDPARAAVCELIVDTANKIAKEKDARQEPTEAHILQAVKKQIKQAEGAIDLIKTNGGDTSKQEAQLVLLREYLPPQMSEEECRAAVLKVLETLPEADRIKKNQGKIMGMMKSVENIDMGLVSRILGPLLK